MPDPLLPPEPDSALSAVPAAGSRRGLPPAGVLKFFYGPMDCGKSTLALQLDYNHSRQGRRGLLLTKLDRSRRGQITSRMGLSKPAIEVDGDLDLRRLVRDCWAKGRRVDYVIADEVQFFSTEQIDQLAQLADEAQLDVYAFGIATDFRSRLFPGSQRLFELADEILPVQVEVLCWCGRPGRFNARVVNGAIVRHGATVVVADTAETDAGTEADAADASGANTAGSNGISGTDAAAPAEEHVRYQVLCRIHHRSGDLGPNADTDPALPLG